MPPHPRRKHDSSVRRKLSGFAKAKALRRRRSEYLDFGTNRRPVPSPVKAPLIFHPKSEGTSLQPVPSDRHSEDQRPARLRREAVLWKAYLETHSVEARNALWVHYQGLVRFIAEQQKAKLPECVELGDLISGGNMGLLDAIKRFDPERKVRFETYCVPRIRGAMLDHIRQRDWVPRLIRNKVHQFERLVGELAARLGREPSDDEIAERLKMDPKRFALLRRELEVKAQISYEGGDSDRASSRDLMRLEMLGDDQVVEPTGELQREEIRRVAFRGLHPNERWVVEQYYFKGRSMKQIGEDLNLSESRVCQIHAQVMEVLKRKFRSYQDSCYI